MVAVNEPDSGGPIGSDRQTMEKHATPGASQPTGGKNPKAISKPVALFAAASTVLIGGLCIWAAVAGGSTPTATAPPATTTVTEAPATSALTSAQAPAATFCQAWASWNIALANNAVFSTSEQATLNADAQAAGQPIVADFVQWDADFANQPPDASGDAIVQTDTEKLNNACKGY